MPEGRWSEECVSEVQSDRVTRKIEVIGGENELHDVVLDNLTISVHLSIVLRQVYQSSAADEECLATLVLMVLAALHEKYTTRMHELCSSEPDANRIVCRVNACQ